MSIQQAPTGDFRRRSDDTAAAIAHLRHVAHPRFRPRRRPGAADRPAIRWPAATSFRPGTNFPGWLFRIERNEFISGLRRERPTVALNDAIANTLSHPPRQESGIVMREFKKAFGGPDGLASARRC